MFLKNTWYIAAWSRDIGSELLTRTILTEQIVLFRKSDGAVVALEDACPHRKLPLSKGRIVGDVVECGYHGMQFDCSGRCVLVPTQDSIPPKARRKAYPIAEKWGFVWIWMGDADAADESRIYEVANYDDPGWGRTDGGELNANCHYLWLTDNLLDPSHVAWVHRTSFSAPGTDDTPLRTQVFDDGVVVSRWILDQPPPPYFAAVVTFSGNCDRLQHYEVRMPSICINRSIFTPAGTGGEDAELDDRAYVMMSYNFMTPVDSDRTTYYWFQQYNTDIDDEAVAARLNEGAVMAFNEDREILEAVHSGMASKTTPNLDLGLDAGSLRFRKLLGNAIACEQSEAQTADD
jgi:vanillate O-demethylase monooxygenase subunit